MAGTSLFNLTYNGRTAVLPIVERSISEMATIRSGGLLPCSDDTGAIHNPPRTFGLAGAWTGKVSAKWTVLPNGRKTGESETWPGIVVDH
jgi:hypothetical protein